MEKFVEVGLIALTVVMVLALIGILVHRSLPIWREDRQEFITDLCNVFAASFSVALAVVFLSFMGMLVAATQQQATISLYVFLGGLVYAVVVGVIFT